MNDHSIVKSIAGASLINKAAEIAYSKLGINISSLGTLIIEQAVKTRLKLTAKSEEQYRELLITSQDEQNSLTQLLLVSESWFEREQESLRLVIEELAKRQSSLCVLSAPCARGEEPVTALYLALQAGFQKNSVLLEGYDLSEQAIQRAKSGEFNAYSFRGSSRQFKASCFDYDGNNYHLKDNLKNSIYFSVGNLLDPAWSPKTLQFDIILCRNLMIYLEREAQECLIKNLFKFLNPNGYIITSSSEAVILNRIGLIRSKLNCGVFNFITKRDQNQSCIKRKINSARSKKKNINKCQTLNKPAKSPKAEENKIKESQLGETFIKQLADGGEFDKAFRYGLELLETDPNNPEIHFILGVIASSCNQKKQAISWIEKALDLRPDFEEARLYIDNIKV